MTTVGTGRPKKASAMTSLAGRTVWNVRCITYRSANEKEAPLSLDPGIDCLFFYFY